MNSITLVGRLGGDAEVTYLDSGTQVTKFRMAVRGTKKDAATGDWHTDWFSVSAFGQTGANISEWLTKGRMVGVTGRLDTWKRQDGTTGFAVSASRVDLLDKPKNGGNTETADPQPVEAEA